MDDVYFLGSVVRIHVRLREQYINVDMFNNPGTVFPAVGELVTLSFLPDACRVLKQETA